jgi:hypothetical protein
MRNILVSDPQGKKKEHMSDTSHTEWKIDQNLTQEQE